MLSISNLTIKNHQIPLFTADFTIFPYSLVALTGPNGSGKSTLLRTIAGLRKETQGQNSLDIEDRQLRGKSFKQAVFYFESVNWLDKNLSGMDYLKLYNKVWQADPDLIERTVNRWQSHDYIKQPIYKYSLGMKQKLVLSLYEVTNPTYWLMDEPTNGLDYESLNQFKSYLQTQRDEGKAFLIATHEQVDFLNLCDKIYSIQGHQLEEREVSHHEAI
ncbi:ATP-binding cassette domain-containing protein [Facklamia sp. P13055]|uniref:ATP-binding cassette domain-containing protein n=1 Tax=Facklamia sp. P13055 TaxID=3421952 RepID=UPI003D16C587